MWYPEVCFAKKSIKQEIAIKKVDETNASFDDAVNQVQIGTSYIFYFP